MTIIFLKIARRIIRERRDIALIGRLVIFHYAVGFRKIESSSHFGLRIRDIVWSRASIIVYLRAVSRLPSEFESTRYGWSFWTIFSWSNTWALDFLLSRPLTESPTLRSFRTPKIRSGKIPRTWCSFIQFIYSILFSKSKASVRILSKLIMS
jgi:hypothetical protein